MRIRAITVFVGLFVLLAATTSSAQKGRKAPPPQLVIMDASVLRIPLKLNTDSADGERGFRRR